jgi:hypothetical protein
MTDRPNRNIDDKSIPGWVKDLPSVEADADFRARLKSEFTEGRMAAEQPEVPESAGGKSGFAWWRWLVPAAAAAVLVIVAVNQNRGPALRVARAMGLGEVLSGGERIALSDTEKLNDAIAAAGMLETPAGGTLDLLADDVVLLEVTAATRMTIPRTPGRWFGRAAACSLFAGEMRIKTGRNFQGAELAVFTPEGKVEITGTLLSIQRDEGGTCVCVLEGVARVGMDENDMESVEPGFRKVMFADGTAEIIPVKPMHRDGVLEFDRHMGRHIEYQK